MLVNHYEDNDAKLVDHSEDDEKKIDFPLEEHLVDHSVNVEAKHANHSEDDGKTLDLPSETHLANHSDDDKAPPPCLSDVASVCPLACEAPLWPSPVEVYELFLRRLAQEGRTDEPPTGARFLLDHLFGCFSLLRLSPLVCLSASHTQQRCVYIFASAKTIPPPPSAKTRSLILHEGSMH